MKTTYLIALAILALGTFSCSPNTTMDSQGFEETGGSAGSAGIGDAGSGSKVSGSGGEVVQPTGGTGADLAGGTAGEPSLGGTAGEPSTGGTGNTGGTCTPKTCLTIAVELAGGQIDLAPEACGIVDDGCGNLIDCGGCDSEYSDCGGWLGEYRNENLCSSNMGCSALPVDTSYYWCASPLQAVICTGGALDSYYLAKGCHADEEENTWCCFLD